MSNERDLDMELLAGVFPDEADRRKKAEEARKAMDEQSVRDMQAILRMEGGEGRRVMFRILHYMGLFRKCMTGNSMTYYNLGQHESAQELYMLLQIADPEAALDIMRKGMETYNK